MYKYINIFIVSQDIYDKIISFGFIYEFRLKMYNALSKVIAKE